MTDEYAVIDFVVPGELYERIRLAAERLKMTPQQFIEMVIGHGVVLEGALDLEAKAIAAELLSVAKGTS